MSAKCTRAGDQGPGAGSAAARGLEAVVWVWQSGCDPGGQVPQVSGEEPDGHDKTGCPGDGQRIDGKFSLCSAISAVEDARGRAV
jgi:hypothetical protein